MTKEDIISAFKSIIKISDTIINNKNYTADDFVQDRVEDIAEMCHRIVDGQYGEIVEEIIPVEEAYNKGFNDGAKAEEGKILKGWVARDKNKEGDGLAIYIGLPPERFEEGGWWNNRGDSWMVIPENMFPDVKWENEPKAVEIIIH